MSAPGPVNGGGLTDIEGRPVHAHGGGMIAVDGWHYWFGEDRHPDNTFRSVAVHRTRDLLAWEYCGSALTDGSDPELARANVERPKVLFDAGTGCFVMWMHKEEAGHYRQARAAVAVADRAQGPYRYLGSFRPLEHMSRDLTLFQDTDGTGYLVSAANDNADLHLYRLAADHRTAAELVAVLWPGAYREAPALFRRGTAYVLLTSGCSSWAPNQQQYATAGALAGPWSALTDIADRTCYGSQTAYVLPWRAPEAAPDSEPRFLYLGDRWAPHTGGTVNDSGYVRLALDFDAGFGAAGAGEVAAEAGTRRMRMAWQPRMWTPPA